MTFLTKPNQTTSFYAQTNSSSKIYLSWTKGTGANNTRIQRKTGSYPTSISDGTNVYNGTSTQCEDTGLAAGTTYYYRSWSFTIWGDLSQWANDYTNASNQTSSSSTPSNPDKSPTANAGGPYSGYAGASITFRGSGTPYSGRTITSYTWSFGDGSTGSGATTTHAYAEAGRYTARLTVADSSGDTDSDTATVIISAEPAEPTLPTEEPSNETIDEINEEYGVNLSEPFYATDTDGDGTVDTFVDPNNLLTDVNGVDIDGQASFLLSTDGDNIPEFFWNTQTGTVTQITHAPPQATAEPAINEVEQTITIEITVAKANWIYIDVSDQYPDYTLTVKASDGRTISEDKIWREDGKIYVLDDPDTTYNFIYGYTIAIVEPTTTATGMPLWQIIVIAALIIIAIIAIIIVALFKTGRLFIEKIPGEEKPKKPIK